MTNQIKHDIKGKTSRKEVISIFNKKDLLTTKAAAEILGIKPQTLETHRCRGTGPKFERFFGRVLYFEKDLVEYKKGRWQRR